MSTINEFPIKKIGKLDYGALLGEIPDSPSSVYVRGELPTPDSARLAIVGSRSYSDYAPQVIDYLVGGLRNYNISIISGLAIGVDSLAHKAALSSGLHTLAVPGSGLDDSVIYPARNKQLAHTILESGGGLLSEFEPTFSATQWSFPKRNRIMAGLSHATLLIEASEKSGTLITARLAVDFNRELLVVPGNIFSKNSYGIHQFLKLGATPITTPLDIIDALGLIKHEHAQTGVLPDQETAILSLLDEPKAKDELLRSASAEASATLSLLMKMELKGLIQESNGIYFKI